MPDGLRLALTTFTVLPLRPGPVDRRTAGQAMRLAPLVGLLLGLAAAAVLFVLRLLERGTTYPLLPAAATVLTLAVASRGLHLDGLADTADGLAAYTSPARALEIMHKPDVGPLGVAAVVLTLLVQIGALAACVRAERGTLSVLLAVVAGRLAVLWACTPATPAARTDGLGALVAGTVRRSVPWAWLLVVGAGAVAYASLDDRGRLPGSLRALLALGLGLLAATVLRRHAVRRFGGITGDVLGALVEVTTTVVLVVMSLDLPARLLR